MGLRNLFHCSQWMHRPSYILVRFRQVAATPWPHRGHVNLAWPNPLPRITDVWHITDKRLAMATERGGPGRGRPHQERFRVRGGRGPGVRGRGWTLQLGRRGRTRPGCASPIQSPVWVGFSHRGSLKAPVDPRPAPWTTWPLLPGRTTITIDARQQAVRPCPGRPHQGRRGTVPARLLV